MCGYKYFINNNYYYIKKVYYVSKEPHCTILLIFMAVMIISICLSLSPGKRC